jgi:hypothetical protein
MTGWVILVVFDGLMVLFEAELGVLDGLYRLLTLTVPGDVLGPIYLGPVEGELGRLGVGAADLELPPPYDLLPVLGDCDLIEGEREGDVRL